SRRAHQVGSIGMVAIAFQAIGAPHFSAAAADGIAVSQCAARKRRPVVVAAASLTSQSSCGTLISGRSILLRSATRPPGTVAAAGSSTLAVTPGPARSSDITAVAASAAALLARYSM